jgi:hypothetical protein
MRLVLAAALLATAAPVHAGRYAVLAANNQGWAGEAPLRFAHEDARRLASTLSELGDFPRRNVRVVTSATPRDIEVAVRAMAARMRLRSSKSGGRHLFFFFFSGHADETALHPGRHALAYTRLKALLSGVPAEVRIGVLDSCKSGALTRLKGAQPGPSFDVRVSRGASGRVVGDVFISSAAVTENAQESARLRGSFFTSFVNSGLRGAADGDRDGKVTLGELYAFAYRMTVGRTSATRAGAQHPAHRIDLRGRGEVVLTHPGRARCCLLFDAGSRRRYLILRDADEAMVAEVTGSTRPGRIGVAAGRYKVRRSSPSGVYEQRLELLAGECKRVKDGRMKRILLPSTLSKGALLDEMWSAGAAYVASVTSVDRSTLPVHHVSLSLRVPLGRLALRPELQFGRGSYSAEMGAIETDVLALSSSLTFDIPTRLGLFALGPHVGYTLTRQIMTYAGADDPAARGWSSGLQLGVAAMFSTPLFWRLALALEARFGYALLGLGHDLDYQPFIELGVGPRLWF